MDFPQAEFVRTRSATLEVFRAGTAGGPAIVLCHGWPEHAYSWRHQIPVLAAAGFDVIVPNQRGYGGSSCPEAIEAYDIKAMEPCALKTKRLLHIKILTKNLGVMPNT